MKIRVTQSFLKMERTKKDLELSLLQCRGSLAAQRVTIGDYIDQEHWGHFKTNSHTTWIKHTPQDKQTQMFENYNCHFRNAIYKMYYWGHIHLLRHVVGSRSQQWMNGTIYCDGLLLLRFRFLFLSFTNLACFFVDFFCLFVVACSQPLLPCPSMP